jgi:hypothetical protein
LRQIAAAVNDPLNADGAGNHAEQNDVTAHDSEAGIIPDFGSKLKQIRLLRDAKHFPPDSPNEDDSSFRVLFSDEIGDCFEIIFDETGKL